MKLVYCITHPEVVVDQLIPVPRWTLSERGRARMAILLTQPWIAQIGSIYSSTEQKAMDGAAILSAHLGLPSKAIEALGEIDRSSTGFLPHAEHQATAERLFAEPEVNVRGWERACDAQYRMVEATDRLIREDRGSGHIAVVTHGGVATLLLCHLKGQPIDIAEGQPGNGGGCYFCFEAESRALVHGWRLIDARGDL